MVPGWSFETRHVQMLLLSICLYTLKCVSVGHNMAILAMTDKIHSGNVAVWFIIIHIFN